MSRFVRPSATKASTSNEERDGHPLAVLEPGREIDDNLRRIGLC